MSLVFDVFIIVFLFFLFAFSHSVLASFDVKKRISEKVGKKIAFYRLFYNISSILIFIAIYYLLPKPRFVIYDLQFPYDLFIFGVQIFGIIGFFWTGSYINLGEFIGLSQAKRYFKGNYEISSLDENTNLVIAGPFKISRHPIYFFSLIILGFRPVMDLFYLVFFICIFAYFYLGSVYEEKNREKKFGESYSIYKNKVPRLIPNPILLFKLISSNK